MTPEAWNNTPPKSAPLPYTDADWAAEIAIWDSAPDSHPDPRLRAIALRCALFLCIVCWSALVVFLAL